MKHLLPQDHSHHWLIIKRFKGQNLVQVNYQKKQHHLLKEKIHTWMLISVNQTFMNLHGNYILERFVNNTTSSF
jgi:hypothetical protein